MRLPLSAVVGQAEAKLALQLAAIDPSLGGVLLRGPRGTAKSSMARGLAAWLDGAPFVDLPLGADEDKLVGSLDLQAVLQDKHVRAEPGLLARADGGVLYADEVNLLPDHLVDLLLDAAASGVVQVEREGVSRRFDAAFVLVGTMNPDEGDLRPQLLDRFGLCVDVLTPTDPRERSAVLHQRLQAQHDGARFAAEHAAAEDAARARLRAARAGLAAVAVAHMCERVAVACADAGVDGLRGDLAWLAAARAHAALHGRSRVEDDDLAVTRDLALRHRLPEQPPEPPTGRRPNDSRQSTRPDSAAVAASVPSLARDGDSARAEARVGRGARGQTAATRDRAGAARRVETGAAVAWASTLRHAGGVPTSIEAIRHRARYRKQGGAWIVLLDCSASMLRGGVLARTQGAVADLVRQAYWQRRDIAVLRFGGDGVETLVPLGRAPKRTPLCVRVVQGGGGTPLAAGLAAVRELVHRAAGDATDRQLWLFTDGRVPRQTLPDPGCAVTVVDTLGGAGGHARRLATQLGGESRALDSLVRRAA
ncbi:MAG: ATP-binding protein [Pseudomonadota bacterium]